MNNVERNTMNHIKNAISDLETAGLSPENIDSFIRVLVLGVSWTFAAVQKASHDEIGTKDIDRAIDEVSAAMKNAVRQARDFNQNTTSH